MSSIGKVLTLFFRDIQGSFNNHVDKKGSKICHFSPRLVCKNVVGGRLLVKKVQNYVQMVFECPLTHPAKIDLNKK